MRPNHEIDACCADYCQIRRKCSEITNISWPDFDYYVGFYVPADSINAPRAWVEAARRFKIHAIRVILGDCPAGLKPNWILQADGSVVRP